ncbi:hypothetical protein TNCV_4820751 [Trichonephila clavipes]|nr:hypothetical protein TNCV_4820751 [Trichonephila clavipes]
MYQLSNRSGVGVNEYPIVFPKSDRFTLEDKVRIFVEECTLRDKEFEGVKKSLLVDFLKQHGGENRDICTFSSQQ